MKRIVERDRRRVTHQTTDGNRHEHLLRRLHPVFELSALIRPRLLTVAVPAVTDPIFLGLLYHTAKNAVQYRLQYRGAAGAPAVFRRTRWMPLDNQRAFRQTRNSVTQNFARAAAKLGSKQVHTVEFAPHASDEEILDALLSSPIPALLR